MACDPNELANLARCFACLPAATLLEIQTLLLCQINEAGGAGGGGGGEETVYSNPGAGAGSEEFGLNANADGVDSSAFGSDSSAGGVEGTAFGSNSNAAGAGALAIGAFASAIPAEATAIGGHTTVSALGGVALGPAAQVDAGADFGVAIGDAAHVDGGHINSVAIGTEATTDDDHQIMLGTNAYEIKIPGNLTVEGKINGVKRYVALLTQIGAGAPTATVLENSMGGTIVFTRIDAGNYNGTLAGAFVASPWIVLGNTAQDASFPTMISAFRSGDNTITILTGAVDAFADDILAGTPIEIRVYP